MICFPLFEGEQITQILLGLFLEIYFREYFSRRGWDVFSIPRESDFTPRKICERKHTLYYNPTQKHQTPPNYYLQSNQIYNTII